RRETEISWRGRARPARDRRRREHSADWMTSFMREANPHEPAPSHERLNRLAGEALFWIVDDEPVSMAAIVRRTRNAAAISAVYTPTPLRGKGYAGSVTAAVAEQAFAEGKRVACLYTDLRNPFQIAATSRSVSSRFATARTFQER